METKYAIRCETEEQARECMWWHDPKDVSWLLCNKWVFWKWNVWNEEFIKLQWLEIISYQEAKEKWLLGDSGLLDSTKWLEPSNNEQLIEDIIKKLKCHEIQITEESECSTRCLFEEYIVREVLNEYLSK